MGVDEEDYVDFGTVNYKSHDEERKTPIKRYTTALAITFCIIGFFLLFTSFIVIFQAPDFLLQISEGIIFASLPFVSFNEEVIGIIPTSVLFLLLSLSMLFLRDEKHFTFIQFFLAIVSVTSFLYFILYV
jgi:hypothetical protein